MSHPKEYSLVAAGLERPLTEQDAKIMAQEIAIGVMWWHLKGIVWFDDNRDTGYSSKECAGYVVWDPAQDARHTEMALRKFPKLKLSKGMATWDASLYEGNFASANTITLATCKAICLHLEHVTQLI